MVGKGTNQPKAQRRFQPSLKPCDAAPLRRVPSCDCVTDPVVPFNIVKLKLKLNTTLPFGSGTPETKARGDRAVKDESSFGPLTTRPSGFQ